MTEEEYEIITLSYFEATFGAYAGELQMTVHARKNCVGANCCIHNPSDHPLRDAPLQWRADRQLMERRCSHGVGHPDPDDLAFKQLSMPPEKYANGVYDWHGCDGCCH